MKNSICVRTILASRAIIRVTKLMEREPDNKALFFKRACLFCLKGKFSEALAGYSTALGIDSADENLRAGMSSLQEIYRVAGKAVNKAGEV